MAKKHFKPNQLYQVIDYSERLTDTKLWFKMAKK